MMRSATRVATGHDRNKLVPAEPRDLRMRIAFKRNALPKAHCKLLQHFVASVVA